MSGPRVQSGGTSNVRAAGEASEGTLCAGVSECGTWVTECSADIRALALPYLIRGAW
jgi:hypothetical protein